MARRSRSRSMSSRRSRSSSRGRRSEASRSYSRSGSRQGRREGRSEKRDRSDSRDRSPADRKSSERERSVERKDSRSRSVEKSRSKEAADRSASKSVEKSRSKSRRVDNGKEGDEKRSRSRSVSSRKDATEEEAPKERRESRSRSQSSSDVSDVDRTKPRVMRRDRADSRGDLDKVIEEVVDDAIRKQRIVEAEDFLEDSLTMRLLYSVLDRSGRRFLEDVLYETVHSINQDVRSRRDIRIPQKYVGIRVKRVVQRKEDDMAFRRRVAARESRRRPRDRSYSRSSSRSRSRSRHHRVSVSDMCDRYSLDAECEDRLRELSQEQLSRVFGPDLLIRADCRNPSSIVMSRIRDERTSEELQPRPLESQREQVFVEILHPFAEEGVEVARERGQQKQEPKWK
ncbi:hypothetical protein FOZ63_025474 [Perkinsus olseni]|uniref:Uncharacterized protein n=1 Tax=Perkinsus olseni TaxID=32597 RepID=A0A7J6QCT9_PEROL|nr:hypothetical protein FOZ63_025474 [Perkinsus olseni]